MYQKVTTEVIEKLQHIVGPSYVKTNKDELISYAADESMAPELWTMPEVVVAPANAEEIGAIIKLANVYHIPVTPRSAGTSVSGGAIPVCGGIVVLLERLNRILELNEEGLFMVVEAGVRTVDIQQAAREKGLLYAGDPCSADSCLIGGNLATNAGGNKAVRYGTTRHQVYAIEVVLPTGEIVELGGNLKKCSTGFCLEQLIIGSEGTLGVITKATLKLIPAPLYHFDALAVFTDLSKAINFVPNLIKEKLNPTSVEFMDNRFVKRANEYCRLQLPHWQDGYYVIVSLDTYREEELQDNIERLSNICEAAGATDILEADERIWRVRRSCLESTRELSKEATSEDLVVPVLRIAECIETVVQMAAAYDFQVFCLAHAGDGNLHFQILRGNLEKTEWERQLADFRKQAYPFVYSLGGKLSGEHGIGVKRVDYMETYTNPVELMMMKKIKQALDPNAILNPRKVLNVE